VAKALKKRVGVAKPAAKTKAKSKPPAPPAGDVDAAGAESAAESGAVVLDRLWDVVTSRRNADPAVSHSARLLSRGTAKVAQKFGEEAVECLIEAVAGNRDALVTESADVLYHLIVLWVNAGVPPEAVWDELRRREGVSGIAEKAARPRAQALAFRPRTTKIP
jgi:phosphoribosyl-ATP pyrophosphohydrolase